MISTLKKLCRATLVAGIATVATTGVAHSAQTMTVFKSPTCGCCQKWIDRMEDAGFEVNARDTQFMQSIKREHGIPGQFASCHTALIGGYVIEGHVPAKDIEKLLDDFHWVDRRHGCLTFPSGSTQPPQRHHFVVPICMLEWMRKT